MAKKLRIDRPETGGGTDGDTVGLAMKMLLRAFHAASELKRAVWEFAVELRALEHAGVAVTDLRWLVANGYADHRSEMTGHSARLRRFRPACLLGFTDKSCFVLTEAGAHFAHEHLISTLSSIRSQSAKLAGNLIRSDSPQSTPPRFYHFGIENGVSCESAIAW